MKTAVLAWGLLAAVVAGAEVKLADPFSDGAVLQRGRPVVVWGTADPGEAVEVFFGGARAEAKADASGAWRAELPALAASCEGRELVAKGAKGGRAAAKDVVVGEVWLASGQSNMELPIWGGSNRFRDEEGSLLRQYVNRPLIRFLRTSNYKWSATPVKTTAAKWEATTPETIASFSAVAWYFAEELHQALGVPVGILSAHWGGTNIDAWTPREGYANHPELKQVADFPVVAKPEDWKPEMSRAPWHGPMQQPTVLYNMMIAPLAPYTLTGAIWYQGEHNVSDHSAPYGAKMHALYDGWAKVFGNPKLKFYFAQIAAFDYGADNVSRMPLLQVEQAKFAAEEKNAGMAVLADVESWKDVHPHSKRTCARRLALLALKNDYGFTKIVAESPTLKSARGEGRNAVLEFDRADSWFVYNADRSTDVTFEVKDAAGAWHPAVIRNLHVPTGIWDPKQGVVDGAKLVVGSDDCSEPYAVRYLFSRPFKGGLCSNWGLPLGPFEAEVKGPKFGPPPRGWEGLRVGVLGDSITDRGQTSWQNVYWQYLAHWLNWDAKVYGISGHQWSHIPGQTDRMIQEMGDDVDAVLIFVGTNDYVGGVPLGEWYAETEGSVNWWGKDRMLKRRSFNRDAGTYRGRINVALEKLKKRYPETQIVLLTPIHRAFFKCSETNVQPAEDWSNTSGTHIEDYVQAVREAGEIWSCPVIDLYAESGLTPMLKDEYARFFRSKDSDLLHPNSEGHRRIADLIYSRLKALPGTFRRR